MSILYKGQYKVSCSDGHYILAIAKYNQQAKITQIQYGSGPMQPISVPLAELPALVKKCQSSDVTVQYCTFDSNSLHGVFPEIIASEKQKQLASQQCSLTSRYLDQQVEAATGDSEYRIDRPRIESITREEALNLALGTPDVVGAIELPELKTIILQTAGENKDQAVFYIKYGEDWSINLMPLRLDIDDGFSFYTEADLHSKKVQERLQSLFTAWKLRKYQGEFIPKENMALDFVKTDLTLMSSVTGLLNRFGGRGFFNTMPENHRVYYNSVTAVINANDNYSKTIELLKDYTKSNSVFGAFFGRVIHGTWNRNHLDEVENICTTAHTVEEVLNALDRIPLENKVGALARRIEFIRNNYVKNQEDNLQLNQ